MSIHADIKKRPIYSSALQFMTKWKYCTDLKLLVEVLRCEKSLSYSGLIRRFAHIFLHCLQSHTNTHKKNVTLKVHMSHFSPSLRSRGCVKASCTSWSSSASCRETPTAALEVSSTSPPIKNSSKMKYAFSKLKIMSSSHTWWWGEKSQCTTHWTISV